jgi:hypothetical protein
MFHDLLTLIGKYIPEESKESFYTELLSITKNHGINLSLLKGEDSVFDKVWERTENK